MSMIRVECTLAEGKFGFYPPKRRRSGEQFEIEEDKFCKSWMKRLDKPKAKRKPKSTQVEPKAEQADDQPEEALEL